MSKIIVSLFLFLHILYANDCCEKQILESSSSSNLHILFETNSYNIDENDFKKVYNYAEYLFQNCDLNIIIEAHTDDIGTTSDNLYLSFKRANSIREYLIQLGILKDRIKIIGYGETKPKLLNDSAKNRQINRRAKAKISN